MRSPPGFRLPPALAALRLPAAASGSGLLLAAAAEPVGWAPMAWVALLPLYAAVLRVRRARGGAGLGLLCGVVFFGLHLSWILLFGWMAYVALVGVMSLWYAAAAWLAARARGLPGWPVVAAGAWAGLELARGAWPWGGFAWGDLGTTQGAVWGVRALAPVVGASGLSFLAAFVSATVADRWWRGRWAWGSVLAVGAVLGAFAAADAAAFRPPTAGRAVRVAVVQAVVPRPPRPDQDEVVAASLEAATAPLGGGADLVVWPESALGLGVEWGTARAEAAARRAGPLVAGRTSLAGGGASFLNLVDYVDPRRGLVASYAKRHPVPFGEYVPLPWLRRYVRTLGQVPLDMVPGRGVEVFRLPGFTVGTPICFESAFARDVRAFARAGAELIVVSTNNSSFERSPASRQHLAATRMRALELRQWVVQAALSGISAAIAPDGRVVARRGLFRPGVMVARVRARRAASLYAVTGDAFAAAWAAVAGLAVASYGIRRRWKRQ